MMILGIESSCDETAISVITNKGEVLAHILFSQIEEHNKFGGVIPEFAARSHLSVIESLIITLQEKYKINLDNIDAFCATAGPGLMGGLLVGVLVAKTLSFLYNKPFLAINHLQAHALLPTMNNNIKYPYLLLLVSGGHTQFLACLEVNKYKILGQSIDDAIGEAFDKSARLLGLGYPGGKKIEELAKKGNPNAFSFPKPLQYSKECNFSFSGLKTALKNVVENLSYIDDDIKCDICASLQKTIVEIVLDKTKNAITTFENVYGKLSNMVISGGVSANFHLRESLENYLHCIGVELLVPEVNLCTDNAVMVAWCGLKRYELGLFDDLDFKVRSRWSLEDI